VAIATVLSVAWHIVNKTGAITGRSYEAYARLTFFVCPSSILLMEVDPSGPVTWVDLMSYAIAIVINGILYGFVARVLVAIWRSATPPR
jgi:flagellar biosynthesis protein FliR